MGSSIISYTTDSELLSLMRQPNIAIIDVRTGLERIGSGHIAGSLHYTSQIFSVNISKLIPLVQGKDTIIFYCTASENRGPGCAQSFANYVEETKDDYGIKEIKVLRGGLDGWRASNRPICRCKADPCEGGEGAP